MFKRTAKHVGDWLRAGLAALAGGAAIAFLLAKTGAARAFVPDSLVTLLVLAAFVSAPLLLPVAILLGRPARHARTPRRRAFAGAATAMVCVGWLVVALPGLFWSALYVAAVEPWPLSLRQGPDTETARQSFRDHFGFDAGGSVTEIYAYSFNLRDSSTYLRFRVRDASVIDRVVRAKDLSVLPDTMRRDPRANAHAGEARLSWWQRDRIDASKTVYVDRRTAERLVGTAATTLGHHAISNLWLDSESGLAFYRELEF